MKKYIILLLVLFSFTLKAQTITSMHPDSVWEDSKTADWYINGTTFYNYNGTVYSVIMKEVQETSFYAILQQSLYPYFYLFNKDFKNESLSAWKFGNPSQNYINYYGYPQENEAPGMLPQLTGRNFFFEYNGQLWYFQHVLTGLTVNNGKDRKNESYECFAQMNLNSAGKVNKIYYNQYDPVPDLIKMGAFQLDSLIYFISLNENSSSSNYHKWALEKYLFDESSGKIVKPSSSDPNPVFYLNNIKSSTAFGGLFTRLDSLQNLNIMVDTYNPSSSANMIGIIIPSKTSSGYTFSYRTLDSVTYNNIPAASVCLAEGALKGQKTSEPNPTLADRFSYVLTSSAKASDGKYHVYYKEFYIYPNNTLRAMYTGEVTLGNYPSQQSWYVNGDEKKGFDMACAFELIPKDYSSMLAGKDGYQERLDFFYPDGSADPNCAEFYSDQFKLNDLMTIVSADLDDTSYTSIRDLWALNGIVEGAPPCSMNWERWDSTLNLNQHADEPTDLEFLTSSDSTVNTVSTFEDRWSVGATLDFEKEKGGKSKKQLSLSADLKYFGAYEKELGNKMTWKKEAVTKFSLHEYNQEKGCFIWTVPELTRYKYDVYPWWDPKYSYPVPNTTNYLFRTTGVSSYVESIDFEKYPFYLTNVNDCQLQNWKSGGTRDSLVQYTLTYAKPAIDNVSWTSPQNGTAFHYQVAAGSSSKYSYTNGLKEKVTGSVKIPEVFKFSVSQSEEFSFSTNVECETQFGNEISASLLNLTSNTMGVNITHLNIDVYWLRPDSVKVGSDWQQINWWYYDSLGGMKPWYIAYKVNTATANIVLLTPGTTPSESLNDMIFTWDNKGESLRDYVIYIASSPDFNSASLLFRQKTGDFRSFAPGGFAPEPGKKYYWCISGITGSGEVVWSPIGSFSLKDENIIPAEESGWLRAVVSPNPGKNGEMRITFSPGEQESASVIIYSADGNVVYRDNIKFSAGGIENTLKIPVFIKAGIYFAEIKSGNTRIIKKIVII